MLIFLFLIFSMHLDFVCSNNRNENAMTFTFQINGYSNPFSKSSNGTACIRERNSRPDGFPKAYNNSSTPPKCHIRMDILVFPHEDSTISGGAMYSLLDGNGELPQQSKDICNWNFTRNLTGVPWVIEVSTHNFGCVVSTSENYTTEYSFTGLDHFVIDLKKADATPAASGAQNVYHFESKGERRETILSTTVTMGCNGPLIGRYCDLNCTTLKNHPEIAHCQSVYDEEYYICKRLENGLVNGCEQIEQEKPLPYIYRVPCVPEPRRVIFVVDEWKMIAIAIVTPLLVVGLTFLLGYKMSNRSVKNQKKENNVSASAMSLVTL